MRSNILTFIAAGHETTANTITWSLFLLSQSDEWRARVEAEAQREIDGPVAGLAERLVETRAVIDEAIRLYPPIAAISRVAMGPDELAGQRVKRGTYGRDRALCAAPASKCIGTIRTCSIRAASSATAKNEIDRYAYLPFGAGIRTCIGSAFALQEATLILATIVKNFDFKLAPGKNVWPLLRVTLRPDGGLPLTIKCKDAAA